MASAKSAAAKGIDFWPFSLEVYRQPGVESACLSLQETAGLDVNALLFCCWTGAVGYGTLSELEMKAVISAASIMAGWLYSVFSTSMDEIFSPPEIMMSFDLSFSCM